MKLKEAKKLTTKRENLNDKNLLHLESSWIESNLQFSGFQKGKKGDVVYVTAADLTLTPDFFLDESVHYVIHADIVHLVGKIGIPGKNITINARIISSDGDVCIDTSGKASKGYSPIDKAKSIHTPVDQENANIHGEHGENGDSGQTAGNIILAAERFNLNGYLRLIANGSNGGRGQDGGDGKKGFDGADGVDGKIGAFSNKAPTAGSNGTNGGNGGNAGQSGNGGDGGNIFVGYVVSSKESLIKMESASGKAGEAAVPGKGMVGGKGGIGGRIIKKKYITGYMATMVREELSNDREPSGQNGTNGQDGAKAILAIDGKPGLCGVSNDGLPVVINYSDFFGNNSTDLRWISSLEQRLLTLHKASMAYLASNETKLEEAATLLTWIMQTTPDEAWFDEIKPLEVVQNDRDERMLQYTAYRREMMSMSVQWLALRNTAVTLVAQMSQGLDYFGHPWNWVPLMPLDRYQAMGNHLIEAAQQAEIIYKDYLRDTKSQNHQVDSMKKALDAASTRINELEKQKTEIHKEKSERIVRMDTAFQEIQRKEKHLQKEAEEFVNALHSELQLDTAKELFDLAVTGVALVTNVGPVVGALKAGGALASAIHNVLNEGEAIVIDENGKSKAEIKKEKKEQKKELKKSTDSVKKVMSSGYAVVKKGASLRDLSKQMNEAQKNFGYKSTFLTMSRQQFDEMLEPVYNKVPKKAKQYREAFYEFMNVAEVYKQEVRLYDALYIEDAKLTSEIAHLRSEDERLHQMLGESVDASLPLFHTYIFNMYSQVRLQLLDFLYQEYQAFRYLTLSKDQFPRIKGAHIAELSGIHAEITNKLKNILNASDRPVQPFRNVKIIFKEESFPVQFQALRENRAAVFSLSTDNDLIREKIAGKAHMMVSTCHVHLPGVRETEGDVYIEYTHSGYSTFLDQYANRHEFSHYRTHGFYEYEITFENGEKIDSKSGGVVGDGYNRIMPGLLAVWSIKVPKVDPLNHPMNTGVNLDNVNRIEMILEGKAMAYSDKASNNRLRGLELNTKLDTHVHDNEMHVITISSESDREYIVIEL